MKQRESATGITAEWSDEERRWIFPGLSSNMGGPKKGAKTPEKKTEAPASVGAAQKDYNSGKYQQAYEKLVALGKSDPKAAADPTYKKLLAHAKVELDMAG